jgi:hypothetical protein
VSESSNGFTCTCGETGLALQVLVDALDDLAAKEAGQDQEAEQGVGEEDREGNPDALAPDGNDQPVHERDPVRPGADRWDVLAFYEAGE